ncbi:MAG: DUF1559 domain-containing protein, partial [Gemmataceae bacterium]|nr:DUF1559 domain-containing protein [Gemmataceae bacterium]
ERPPSMNLYYGWWFAGSGDYPYFGATDVALGLAETGGPISPESYRPAINPHFNQDVNEVHRWHYWSFHTGGCNWLMADGSVRFLSYNTGQAIMEAAATYRGGETASLP